MAKFVRNFAEKAPALVSGERRPGGGARGEGVCCGHPGARGRREGRREAAARLQPRPAAPGLLGRPSCWALNRDRQEGRVKKPGFTPPRTP
ncbi:hypothetical protein NN561_019838 [Cricetulus griseus]